MKIISRLTKTAAFAVGSIMLAGNASADVDTGGLSVIDDLGEGASQTFLGLEYKIWVIGCFIAGGLILFRVAPIGMVLFALFLGGAFIGNIETIGTWVGITGT